MTPVPTLATIIDGIVAVAIIAAAVVLSALGKIDQSTTIAVIGVGVALIGGTAKAAVALYAQPPEKSALPPQSPPAPQ